MAEQHRCQSAYTSLQVGAKDLTLMKYVFGSKDLFFLTSFWLDIYLEIMLSTLKSIGLNRCIIFVCCCCMSVTAVIMHARMLLSLFNTFYISFLKIQSRQYNLLFFWGNKQYSVNMFLQSPDLSCLAWHPKCPRFPSFCTTVSRLILASSVFADIASSESSWMA